MKILRYSITALLIVYLSGISSAIDFCSCNQAAASVLKIEKPLINAISVQQSCRILQLPANSSCDDVKSSSGIVQPNQESCCCVTHIDTVCDISQDISYKKIILHNFNLKNNALTVSKRLVTVRDLEFIAIFHHIKSFRFSHPFYLRTSALLI